LELYILFHIFIINGATIPIKHTRDHQVDYVFKPLPNFRYSLLLDRVKFLFEIFLPSTKITKLPSILAAILEIKKKIEWKGFPLRERFHPVLD